MKTSNRKGNVFVRKKQRKERNAEKRRKREREREREILLFFFCVLSVVVLFNSFTHFYDETAQ
jgi:hypothetical protein